MSFTQNVYERLPLSLQNVAVSAYGWYWKRLRLGGVFESRLNDWRERESWNDERLHGWQVRRLREVLCTAWDSTEFYRPFWTPHGATRSHLEKFELEDLERLPVVGKENLRTSPGCNWRGGPGSREVGFVRSTSGSTGTPLRVGFSREVFQDIYGAVEARSYNWAGVSIRESRSMLGSRPIVPASQNGPPFWRYNMFERQVYLSGLHLSSSSVGDYADALNRFRPVTMTGYASAQSILAGLLEAAGLEVHSPRAVIATSDALDDKMKMTLESVFRAQVHQSWGLVENCAFATTCEHGRLHVHPDFGIVEVLGEDNSRAAPGETGRLVVTGLTNTTSLFIRYDTGDLGAWSGAPCPCGRGTFPVLAEIVGRVEDVVVGANDVRLRRFDRVFTDFPSIRRAQVIQESRELVRVLLEADPDYENRFSGQISARMRDLLGAMRIEVEKVDSIPLTAGGKFRAVISRISEGGEYQSSME
ncbi:MAG: phenylacetate--CoA ligase family protein [Candidatus Glassbacteria bacterium]|nr:phenylacetate--CoA ligase family protein [Candidatus Glassbacteria bacterium]